MGKGFAFIGKQYHLEVGGDDFYIDLLCYNVRLHAYTVLEIKNRAFKPADSGQLNFYLSVVDDQLKTEGDNPSIGLILCKDKNNIVAEYALRGMSQPIGVSKFELSPTIPEELRDSLPTLEEVQAEFSDEDET